MSWLYAPAPRKKACEPAEALRFAYPAYSRRSSISLAAGGRSSRPVLRNFAGIVEKRSAGEAAPTASSIAATSASPWGKNLMSVLLPREERLVRRGVHQGGGLRRGVEADLEDPSAAVGVFVDDLGMIHERAVDLDDLARHRGVDLGH